MINEVTHDGFIIISELIDNTLITHKYEGYSLSEAKRLFKRRYHLKVQKKEVI